MSIEAKVIRELRRNGYTVLTRRQWGSKRRKLYQTRRATRRFVGPADYFFAHISVTRAVADARAAMRTLEVIGYDRFRSGVSYSWGIHRPSRTILLGMPHDAAGTHTVNDKRVAGFPENLNYWGHAIALIGMPGDPFDDWCVEAVAAIMAAEVKHGAAKPTAAGSLHPHSKFAAKDCPSDAYRNALGRIQAKAQQLLAPAKPKKPAKPTRVTRAKVQLAGALELLDAAVRGGRRGRVAKVRTAVRRQTARLPKR